MTSGTHSIHDLINVKTLEAARNEYRAKLERSGAGGIREHRCIKVVNKLDKLLNEVYSLQTSLEELSMLDEIEDS
jgi:flagellar biosynthesis chaperone FliJ